MKLISSYYFAFITFLIIIKFILFIFIVLRFVLKRQKKENTILYKNLELWRVRCEGIFILCMSSLTIYIFNPRRKKEFVFDDYTKFLFFFFGIILIINHYKDIVHI